MVRLLMGRLAEILAGPFGDVKLAFSSLQGREPEEMISDGGV
jgi:hypothetical protein